jgi:hypothetical protein
MTRATQRLVILTGNGPVAHDQSWGWFVHGMPAELSGITRVTPTATMAIAMNLMAPRKNLAKQRSGLQRIWGEQHDAGAL